MDAEQIVKVTSALEGEKANISNVFQDIKRYFLPNRGNITSMQSPGTQSDTQTRFDSTGMEANRLLMSSIQSAMVPATSEWFGLGFREEDIANDKSVIDWLEDCAQRMHKAYNASNFGIKYGEGFLDLGGFGTTAILQEELPRDRVGSFAGVRFDTFAAAEYVFTTSPLGQADGLYRRFSFTAQQIKDKFEDLPGFRGFGSSIDGALKATDKSKKQEKFEIVHAIFPRQHFNQKFGGAINLPVASVYVAVKDKHILKDGGYHEFPAVIPRWELTAEDNGWGRSPAWIALPEVKTLNQWEKLELKAMVKEISPPLLVPNKSVVGGMRTTPNAINYYDARRTGGQKPEYLNAGVNWAIEDAKKRAKQEQVRRIFFVDQLQFSPDAPQMTATEVLERTVQARRAMGPNFFRLSFEMLDATVSRTFNIMLRAGAFLPPPAILQDRQRRGLDLTLDVTYVSPLARAQRQEDVSATLQAYQSGAQIAEAKQDPSVLDNFDDDAAIDVISKQLGVPAKIMRGKEEVAGIREARNQQARQQQELEQAAAATQVAEAAAGAQAKGGVVAA